MNQVENHFWHPLDHCAIGIESRWTLLGLEIFNILNKLYWDSINMLTVDLEDLVDSEDSEKFIEEFIGTHFPIGLVNMKHIRTGIIKAYCN